LRHEAKQVKAHSLLLDFPVLDPAQFLNRERNAPVSGGHSHEWTAMRGAYCDPRGHHVPFADDVVDCLLNVGESNEELLKRQLQPRQPRLSSRDVVTIGVREKPVRSLRVLRVDDLGLKPSDEFLSSLFSSADIDLPSRSA
jgi:hypothetical protein